MSKAATSTDTQRACGSCRLCCKLLSVDEIDKPAFRWCEHACSGGCGIYRRRPGTCAGFVCAWLMGWFREEDRPDKSKVVFSPQVGVDGAPVFVVHEQRHGAHTSARAQRMIGEVNARGHSAHWCWSDRGLLGPNDRAPRPPRPDDPLGQLPDGNVPLMRGDGGFASAPEGSAAAEWARGQGWDEVSVSEWNAARKKAALAGTLL